MSMVTGEGNVFAIGFPEVADINVDVAALQDGLLRVYVTALAGDFIAIDSTLYGEAAPPVPEPATMVLFGLGGIATAASRFRKKK